MRSKIPVSGRETEPLLRVSIAPYNDESDLDPTAPGAPAPAGRRVPGALTPADELAVAGDTVGAVGVDEVAASAAPDRVADAATTATQLSFTTRPPILGADPKSRRPDSNRGPLHCENRERGRQVSASGLDRPSVQAYEGGLGTESCPQSCPQDVSH